MFVKYTRSTVRNRCKMLIFPSVKEQEKQTRMKKQKYKITTKCPQKVYKNHTTNVCKMSMNKVHPMSSQCMYLFKTICQNANIFFVKKS